MCNAETKACGQCMWNGLLVIRVEVTQNVTVETCPDLHQDLLNMTDTEARDNPMCFGNTALGIRCSACTTELEACVPTSQHLVVVIPKLPEARVRVLRQQPDRLLPHLDVLQNA